MTSPTSRVGTWLFPSSLWFNEATTEVAVVAAVVVTTGGKASQDKGLIGCAVTMVQAAKNARSRTPTRRTVYTKGVRCPELLH